jgi:hypothetical protein
MLYCRPNPQLPAGGFAFLSGELLMARPGLNLQEQLPDHGRDGQPPILVFFDCEFTDFSEYADLLSVGLVAADTDVELYIETTDALRQMSSGFVRHTVLPLLGRHNPELLTKTATGPRILEWFEVLREQAGGRQVLLVSDSPWDWRVLQEVWDPSPPDVLPQMVQNMLESDPLWACNVAMERYHAEHMEQHHALVDARALKAGWLSVKGEH